MAELEGDPHPTVACTLLGFMTWLLSVRGVRQGFERPDLVLARVCLYDSSVTDPLLKFCIMHIARDPRSDLELMAVLAAKILDSILFESVGVDAKLSFVVKKSLLDGRCAQKSCHSEPNGRVNKKHPFNAQAFKNNAFYVHLVLHLKILCCGSLATCDSPYRSLIFLSG